MDPIDLLRFLLDPGRLAVVGALAAAADDAPGLAARSGQPEADVVRTLATLVQGGLVERDGQRYGLEVEGWRQVARELPQDAPASRRVAFGMTEQEGQVLARFFRGDRLVEIPSARAKRVIVLQRLALEFEPGVHYPELEVNAILGAFHDDHASLRRALVDEGFIDRANGEYWRSGGRVV